MYVSIILSSFLIHHFQSFINPNPSSGSFAIPEILSPSQTRYKPYEPPPPPPPSSFVNDQYLLSAAAFAASHSYPPPSSYLSPMTTANFLSSSNYFDEKRDFLDPRVLLPTDVKNLIESSLTAIGLENVNDKDFDRTGINRPFSSELVPDDDIDSFERSTTSTQILPTKQITRPMNIPHAFSHDYFSQSSSAVKSPFEHTNQLFDEPLESVCLPLLVISWKFVGILAD